MGISTFEPSLSAKEFIENADKAFYKAKGNGKNRVELY